MSSSYSGQSVKFIYRNHMVTVYDAVGQELYTYATFKEPTSKEVNERVALHQAVMNKSEKVYSLQC
ncbi:MAG: hypothetical protein HZB65_04220 [Candidatus Aenigmarchaeota archaeon]|nr:hypothetical protein [Candidatus Aenigmarchaeota archaeon]